MKTIGIDLGTTNSCVYYLDENDQPVLIVDARGRKIFPSAVWRSSVKHEAVVGHRAKSRLGHHPAPVVTVKRKMGTNAEVMLGGQPVSPVEVSALILNYAKALAEEITQDQVEGVVITIPAYFDIPAKQDTHAAAVEAFYGGDPAAAEGRLELMLEPEAAALAYTLEDDAERLRVLVYDLGGGTFDVTILEKDPESGLTVLKFGGDPHLGGDNVDDRIAAWLLYLLRGGKPEALDRVLEPDRYPAETRYTILQQVLTNDVEGLRGELRSDDRDLLIGPQPPYALALDASNAEDELRIQKLKLLAEKAKIDLTVTSETAIVDQSVFEDHEGEMVELDLTLSRSEFDRLIGDLVERTISSTQSVLADSGLSVEQLDRILLVGGSSRMPVIQETLASVFGGAIQMADPDLIVARGAALRARDLGTASMGTDDSGRMTLDYPHQTSDTCVTILGKLSQALEDHQVYASRDSEELAYASVNRDGFELRDIHLKPGMDNVIDIEVVDQSDNYFAQMQIVIRHNESAGESLGPITTKITKPIRSLGVRGFKTILPEGEPLPARATLVASRATQDDYITIPFYEGERFLENLVIPGIDPDLPIGTAIDLEVEILKDYTARSVGTVRTTQQTHDVEFQISRLELPSLGEMDENLDEVLERLENDISLVRDPNMRAGFSRKIRRLEASYRKARNELNPDLHHLYTLIGELGKVLVEVGGAQEFLEPPFEVFERLVGLTRGQAQALESTSAISKEDAMSKIASLERAGQDAWEQENAADWKLIVAELERLKSDLERSRQDSGSASREHPPEAIQRAIFDWLADMRQQISENQMETQFSAELDQLEQAVRQVDLRQTDQARSDLLELLQNRLQPLHHRINNQLQQTSGKPGAVTTVDFR